MSYKVEVYRDLDPDYSELTVTVYHISLIGKWRVLYTTVEDKGYISPAYIEERYWHKGDAVNAYNNYLQQAQPKNRWTSQKL